MILGKMDARAASSIAGVSGDTDKEVASNGAWIMENRTSATANQATNLQKISDLV